MLQIWIDLCRQHGITEILINIHAHANAIRDFLGEDDKGVKVRISEETNLLGSAGTLLANRDWIGADSAFWIFYADVLTDANLEQVLRVHNTCGQIATLAVYHVPDPRRCGIVTVDQQNIIRQFVEKPEMPSSSLAFSGIMVSGPQIFDFIPKNVPADIGFHVLPKLVGRMAACQISDYLLDIGTPENYQIAQNSWQGLGA
jgi:mannose-1-phosphate guanylyltransferase